MFFGGILMSENEVRTILAVWTIGGATLGWIVWRSLPAPKFILEKIVQGVLGAHLFGWWAISIAPRPWRFLASYTAALVMGFLLPYWVSVERKNKGSE